MYLAHFHSGLCENACCTLCGVAFPYSRFHDKTGRAFVIKSELFFLNISVLPLGQSTSKRISCFHDSHSRAKRMKASLKWGLFKKHVKALSHCFHRAHWDERTFMNRTGRTCFHWPVLPGESFTNVLSYLK